MALLNQMSSYFGMGGESEEERRRREEEERLKAESEASATPFKQTIVTDPVTGRQTMKMEGDVRDFTAENPNTPTVSGPAVPGSNIMADYANKRIGDLNQRMETVSGMVRDPDAYMRQRLGMPTTAPVAPATTPPTAEGVMAGPPREAMMPPEAPVAPAQPTAPTMEGVMAGPPREAMMPAQPGGTAEAPVSKAVLESQRIKSAATTAPTAEGLAMGPSMADAQPEAWLSKLEKAKTDPQALAALNSDSRAPDWFKSITAQELGDVIVRQRKEQDVEKRANEILQNQGRGIERAIKDPSEEGSVFRAYLYSRFGLTDLAKQEQAKFDRGSWSTVTLPDGTQGAVKFKLDGTPVSGLDSTGQALPTETLNTLYGQATGLKGAETGKVLYKDPTGKIQGIITATFVPGKTTPIYTDQNGNRVRPGALTPITAATDAVSAYNVGYAKSGGSTQGTQAAEGITNTQLPAQPGMSGVQGTGGQTGTVSQATAPSQARPAQTNESGGVSPQVVGGVVSAVPGTAVAKPPAGASGPAVPGAGTPIQQKQNIEITGKDREAFVKYTNEDLLPKAESGAKLAGIRRNQIYGPDGILNNPEIAGLLSGTGSQSREFQNLFRDIIAGNFEKDTDLSARIKAVGITDPRMKQVLQVQLQQQREVTPLLIREVAPVGAITDFEQRMAKEAGIDVTRQGLYASLTNLTRSEYQSDMAAYKAVFKSNNPQLQTRQQFDTAWNQEKARLDSVFKRVYEDRARYIGQYNKDGKNNNATVVAFRDHYPVPQFNQETRQWEFKGYSKNALRPKLKEFER
jgi:hypothetical protein